jgi:hypothetical protein
MYRRRNMSNEKFFQLMFWICAFVGCVAIMGRGSCVDSSVAYSAMRDSGFTDVKIIDTFTWTADVNGCDQNDAVGFKVTAKRDGRPVRAIVCAGYPFKGATVRLEGK